MRIIIADDHPLFRMGLKFGLIEEGFDVVAEAKDGIEALEFAETLKPDIMLLDVKMPKMTGIEVCEKTKIPVVLITTFSEPAIIEAARKAGAKGYLNKETSPKELVKHLLLILNNPKKDYLPKTNLPNFTKRENEVLLYIMQGLSNKEIAIKLNLSPDTIKDYVAHIYQKLEVCDRTKAILKAKELGIEFN